MANKFELKPGQGDAEILAQLESTNPDDLPTQLHLSFVKVTDAGVLALVQALAQSSNCRQVELLELSGTKVTDAGVEAVVQSANFRQLQSLDLGGTNVTDAGVEALAQSSNIRLLQSLDLGYSQVTDAGVQALAQSANFRQLQSLDLGFSQVTDVGVQALAQSANCGQFQQIYLGNTKVTDAGVRALAKSANFRQMQSLHLEWTQVTDAGMKDLANSANFRQLRTLSLGTTQVTDAGMKELANSANFRQLKDLYLSDTQIKLPEEVRRSHDVQAILKYFREAWQVGSRSLLEVKVAILGLGRLGKSELAQHLTHAGPRPRPCRRDNPATHAFERLTMALLVQRKGTEHQVLVRMFDFGGQPELHAAHRFFLCERRNVFIVVISARQTRAANRLDYWLRMVKHQGGSAPVIVVVSHNDSEAAAGEDRYHSKHDRLEPLDATALVREHGIPVEVVYDYSNVTRVGLEHVRELLKGAIATLDDVFDLPFSPNFFDVHAWVNGAPPGSLGDHRAGLPALANYPGFTQMQPNLRKEGGPDRLVNSEK